jgi:hypothetical protein
MVSGSLPGDFSKCQISADDFGNDFNQNTNITCTMLFDFKLVSQNVDIKIPTKLRISPPFIMSQLGEWDSLNKKKFCSHERTRDSWYGKSLVLVVIVFVHLLLGSSCVARNIAFWTVFEYSGQGVVWAL